VVLHNALMNIHICQLPENYRIFIKFLHTQLHTYCLASEDIDSSTGVEWITIVIALCGFSSINFWAHIYLIDRDILFLKDGK